MDHTDTLVNSCFNFMGSTLTTKFDDHMLFDSRFNLTTRRPGQLGSLDGVRLESLVVWSRVVDTSTRQEKL